MGTVKENDPNRGAKDPARVMIVDDHPVVRAGLVALIEQEADLTVCGEAEEAVEALSLLERVRPDIVILDVTLKETCGIELLGDIRIRYPELPVLALSVHDERVYAERLLRAGAQGYIMKHEGTLKVIEGIRAVLKGEIYLSDRMFYYYRSFRISCIMMNLPCYR